ncbi:hypothetical protein SAMN02927895_05172 [Belnapia rosea]|nr:hypothetical protein SAMN02927895_05172 [Belnapia rosea]
MMLHFLKNNYSCFAATFGSQQRNICLSNTLAHASGKSDFRTAYLSYAAIKIAKIRTFQARLRCDAISSTEQDRETFPLQQLCYFSNFIFHKSIYLRKLLDVIIEVAGRYHLPYVITI